MQDRFKFRVWHKTLGIMHYNDFVITATGYVAPVQEEVAGIDYMMRFNQQDLEFDRQCELMQCTGMKATDGQLLYEGDIIEYKANDYDEPEIAPIVWGDSLEYPAFDLSGKDFDGINGLSYIFAEGYKIKVIGNIYQDSQLLDKSK